MDSESHVRAFCEAFTRRDTKEILGFLAKDALYHNLPLPPLRGHAAIEPMLQAFLGPCVEAEFELIALASGNGRVLTERIDRFVLANGTRIELPVMGSFELGADGLITAWRDYFDLATWTRQMQGGASAS